MADTKGYADGSQGRADRQAINAQRTANATERSADANEAQVRKFGELRASNIGDMAVTLGAQVYKTGREALDLVQEGLKREASDINQNIQGIRELYGGFEKDIDFEYMAESASSQALKRYMVISDSYAKVSNRAIMGTAKTGEEVLNNISDRGNILENLLGNPKVAFQNVDEILSGMTTIFGNQINELEEESVVKMAFYEKSLGTSSQTLQKIFSKQLGFTGEIATDALDKLGAYSANLSKELGIPMKSLTKMTTEMMSNTQMFGDITVEEATRMSAKLSQLGVTMDQLNQQQAKFGSFQGAAQAAGTIAQLTGAQVDAMKMSFLASEGKFDELIDYQRDSLLKAGFTKEKFLNQSNSMRNAIADSFGRSQEELAVLLDTNRRISSQEELDAIMKEGDVAVEDGFDSLLNNIDQTQRAMDSLEERIKKSQIRAQMASTEEAVGMMEKQARINEVQIEAISMLTQESNVARLNQVYSEIGNLYEKVPEKLTDAQAYIDGLVDHANREGGFVDIMRGNYARYQRDEDLEDFADQPVTPDTQTQTSSTTGIVSSTSGQTAPTVKLEHHYKTEVIDPGSGLVRQTITTTENGKEVGTQVKEYIDESLKSYMKKSE